VFCVKDPSTGLLYAVKSMDSSHVSNVVKEIEVLMNEKLVHPRLIRYYSQFMESAKTHIIMEFCENGSLDEWIKTQPNDMPQMEVLKIFAYIVDGVNVLHENNIVHGDIKPKNILLNRFMYYFI
jgi:serine/threonine protein kinase